jgi:hypothetical protein
MFQRESELLYLISFIKTFPAAAAAGHAQVPNNSNGRIVFWVLFLPGHQRVDDYFLLLILVVTRSGQR